MASVNVDGCVVARNTLRADACSVDCIHPRRRGSIANGRLSLSGLVGPVEEWSALMVALTSSVWKSSGQEDRLEI